ncbi:MAG TPA: RDD family protein [Pyrinomonadaceae bacterium]
MTETRTLFTANESEARAESHLDRFRAPFSLRCGALLIDYILVAGIIAFSTLLARMGNRPRASSSSAEMIGIFIAVVVAVINFVGLPVLRGQTLGKWATGLVIRRREGEPLTWGRALLRHLLVYPPLFLMLSLGFLVAEMLPAALVMAGVFIVMLGIGFVIAAFSDHARALHDIIAGTVVVREGARRTRRIH